MEPVTAPARIFRFGLFEADIGTGTLTRNGVRLKIQDQPFRVLILLLEHSGEIVTRAELRQKLWPEGTYVDFDGSLNVVLKKLRAILDDDSENPRFIETIPRRGYRFIAPVEVVRGESSPLPPPSLERDRTQPVRDAASGNDTAIAALRRQIITGKIAWPIGILIPLLLAVLLIIRFNREKKRVEGKELGPESSIAVIPLSNGGAGPSLDYLRFAIASDIVTDLTYARSLSVRPFASTPRYAAEPKDPSTVGRQMKVSYVISGDFVSENGKLRVTCELTRVSDGRVLWRDSVSVPPGELVRLHEDLAERLQNGVITALGGQRMTGEIPSPHSQRAYDLYLRSVAIARDPVPNKTATAALNEAVSEDPGYAPAWVELGWRYYLDAEYSDGGEKAYKASTEASARAAALDPNGTANSIAIKVEHGDLEEGYDEARGLVSRRPDAPAAHFQMAYVYRYAGLLDEAARECNVALTIDPGYFLFRSCSKVFMYKGDYARGQVFLDLDGNSGWSIRQRMHFALRQQEYPLSLALAMIAVQSGYKDAEVILAALEHKSNAALRAVAAREEADAERQSDPEVKYEVATMFAFAGESDRAIRVLRAAIEKNYCALPLVDADPLLSNLRSRTDFQELKARATACQQTFLAHLRSQPTVGSSLLN